LADSTIFNNTGVIRNCTVWGR